MRFLGVGLVMLAAMFWGISGGIADILIERDWDPMVISFYRGAVGLLFFIVWFLLKLRGEHVRSRGLYIWSILAGIGVAGNFSFYFLSIEESSVAVAATLMYTAPIFVLLVSFILRIERSTWFKWGCIGGVLVGIFFLTGAYDFGELSVSLIGAAFGLAAGVSYALFIFGFKNASVIGQPQTTLTIAFLTFSIVLFAFMDRGQALSAATSSDFVWFILLGVIGAGLSFILYMIGLNRTTATTASVVAMVEPVTASVFGVAFMGDSLGLMQILGLVLILATVTLLSAKQSG
ncbi:EamA family transporter [Alkalicoccus urumqiensis]|uniref:EamA family transporter n=1 Tax=Alkalicoccus urumqiensis TaxID=1548213 RepID=A0A2P6MJE4_ALKUR|nr:DMT family transporter [Alkalicoccus urumqiensis]PRO66414.1 EamA family transporter [Alkalicoccus urumqiensis]